MGKMVDLKLTDADKKAEEKRYTSKDPAEQYPYGLGVSFDSSAVAKIAHLQTVNGGDELVMVCRCKVKSVNVDDDDSKNKPRRRVELQIREVDISPAVDDKDFAASFAEIDED